MSLADKLRAKKCPIEDVVVDGDLYQIHGITDRERGDIEAKCRDIKKGILDFPTLTASLLTRCVFDPTTGTQVFTKRDEWGSVPASITGPLKAKVLELTGFDEADLGKSESDLDETDSSTLPT